MKITNEQLADNLQNIQLTNRDRLILRYRLGLADGSTHTLQHVGETFDVTRERIRQIECKAKEKLTKVFLMTE